MFRISQWPLLFALILLFACRQKGIADPLSKEIGREEAQKDFKLFRDLLEDAHPALTEYLTDSLKNALFDSVFSTINKRSSLRDFYKKLSFVADKISCSHTSVYMPEEVINILYERKLFFPFPVVLLDDTLYVNADYELDHGARILSINGIAVKNILDSLMPYNTIEGYSRITQRYLATDNFGFDYYTHFGSPKDFELVLKDTSGKIRTSVFSPVTLDELNSRNERRYYYDATDVDYYLSLNEESNYALLRITSFEQSSSNKERAFEDFLKNTFELLHHKRKSIANLIIDLRENTGGSLYFCFLLHSYLSDHPFREYKAVFSRIKRVPYEKHYYEGPATMPISEINTRLKKEFLVRNQSGYTIPDSLISSWEPRPFRFRGKVFIITNHKVSSAASYFALLSKNNARARIIGTETTGGTYSGNGFKILEFLLPASEIQLRFPYAKMIYSFGEEKSGSGLVPDYPVSDDYESFINNKDRQLIYIADSLISKKR